MVNPCDVSTCILINKKKYRSTIWFPYCTEIWKWMFRIWLSDASSVIDITGSRSIRIHRVWNPGALRPVV